MMEINGLASRIAQLKKDGKDTFKLEKKLTTKVKNKRDKKKVVLVDINPIVEAPYIKTKYEDKSDLFGMFL